MTSSRREPSAVSHEEQPEVTTSSGDRSGPGAAERADSDWAPSRRTFVCRSGKLLVYAAPLVQMFRPTSALAATGDSQLTV
jgi:hypothetical protein